MNPLVVAEKTIHIIKSWMFLQEMERASASAAYRAAIRALLLAGDSSPEVPRHNKPKWSRESFQLTHSEPVTSSQLDQYEAVLLQRGTVLEPEVLAEGFSRAQLLAGTVEQPRQETTQQAGSSATERSGADALSLLSSRTVGTPSQPQEVATGSRLTIRSPSQVNGSEWEHGQQAQEYDIGPG